MALLPATIALLLASQRASTTVSGTVVNGESGAAVPGASVSLAEGERSAITDSEGRYVLRNVSAGPHHVVVRRLGYYRRTFHVLVLRDGALEINVALRPVPRALTPYGFEARFRSPGSRPA